MVTLKTSWKNVKTKAKVNGRWHDNRHTLITDLAESVETLLPYPHGSKAAST